jgi:HK97 family phage prohead protease
MPLPKPKKNEKQKDFINRCMSNKTMKDEYEDNKQRLAVCYSLWVQGKKSDNDETEKRILSFDNTELRVDDEKPMIVGYAAKTGVWADLGWFKERIKSGAFNDVMDNDVRCLKNHDPNLILGRTTNETLRINENTVGLHFENDMPDTTIGRDTREEIRSKLITGCSFAFRVAEDDWKYYEDGRVPERTIIKFSQILDVGPVTYPAYQDTTVAARSLEAFKGIEQKIEPENEQEEKAEQDTGEKKDEQEEKVEQEKKEINFVSDERMRDIKKKYRMAERMINRNRPAED